MSDTILEVKHLKKYFNTPKGTLHAVDDVSFTLERGKTLGIVGESGCGKSTTGRAILRLIEPTAGEVIFNGEDITKKNKEQMRLLRREMQLIFQDPYASLDPRKTVSEIIGGSVLVEQVFSYPGLGQAAVNAGLGSDLPLLLGITVITAAIVFAGNLAADLLYGVVDPKIRRGAARR